MNEPSAPISGSSDVLGRRQRERFTLEEIEAVCSHYDLGKIQRIRELPRGSFQSPKAAIFTDKGEYLLKRRAPGRDRPERLAFVHDLQKHLAKQGFPMPALVSTARSGKTLVRHKGGIYELFEFVRGKSYKGGLDETYEAGRAMAMFHQAAASFRPTLSPPTGSYHAISGISVSLHQIPAAIQRRIGDTDRSRVVNLREVTRLLREEYNEARRIVDAAGFAQWPRQAVHCDWHPGNMRFRGGKVVTVLDFDSARWEPRMIDVANGALQFSITMHSGDVLNWPDYLDETRLKRFYRGYCSLENSQPSTKEVQALPGLMVEALIVEAVVPVATTGSFAHMEGGDFLTMVQRKVAWILRQSGRLTQLVSS